MFETSNKCCETSNKCCKTSNQCLLDNHELNMYKELLQQGFQCSKGPAVNPFLHHIICTMYMLFPHYAENLPIILDTLVYLHVFCFAWNLLPLAGGMISQTLWRSFFFIDKLLMCLSFDICSQLQINARVPSGHASYNACTSAKLAFSNLPFIERSAIHRAICRSLSDLPIVERSVCQDNFLQLSLISRCLVFRLC